MKTVIVDSTEKFFDLSKTWNGILFKSGQNNIFLTFEWLFSWWKHFQKKNRLLIILVIENEEIIGIAPLVISRKLFFRQVRFMSSPRADYGDFIVIGDEEKREQVCNAIFNALSTFNGWDMFRLDGLPSTSLNFSALENALKRNLHLKSFFRTHKHGTFFVPIRGNWQDYCSSLRKKFLADTKRLLTKLPKEQKAFFSNSVKDEHHAASLLEKLIQLHKTRHSSLWQKSIFSCRLTCDFYKEVASVFLKNGWLDLKFLIINDAVAALHFGFIYGNVYYYYIPVFDIQFKQYAAGRLLLYELLRSSFNTGIKKFDFMSGQDEYKSQWQTREEKLYLVSVYPKNIAGVAAFLIFEKGIMFLKKVSGKAW